VRFDSISLERVDATHPQLYRLCFWHGQRNVAIITMYAEDRLAYSGELDGEPFDLLQGELKHVSSSLQNEEV